MIPHLYDCFKHWSASGSVYLVSDTHFDDEDLYAAYPNRLPSADFATRLKTRVHKPDTLIILGDVGNPEHLVQLKCRKVLIMGNHDQSIEKYRPYFDEIYAGPVIVGPKLLLSHEPINIPGVINVHGHNHQNEWDSSSNCRNINPDANDFYYPLSLGELIKHGLLSKIDDIHRQTIDRATKNKKGKKK